MVVELERPSRDLYLAYIIHKYIRKSVHGGAHDIKTYME